MPQARSCSKPPLRELVKYGPKYHAGVMQDAGSTRLSSILRGIMQGVSSSTISLFARRHHGTQNELDRNCAKPTPATNSRSRQYWSIQARKTTGTLNALWPLWPAVFPQFESGRLGEHHWRLRGIWKHLGVVCKHLQASASFWKHPEASGNIWEASGGIWRHLGSISRYLGSIWRHLGSICRHVGGLSRHLETSGSIWIAFGIM